MAAVPLLVLLGNAEVAIGVLLSSEVGRRKEASLLAFPALLFILHGVITGIGLQIEMPRVDVPAWLGGSAGLFPGAIIGALFVGLAGAIFSLSTEAWRRKRGRFVTLGLALGASLGVFGVVVGSIGGAIGTLLLGHRLYGGKEGISARERGATRVIPVATAFTGFIMNAALCSVGCTDPRIGMVYFCCPPAEMVDDLLPAFSAAVLPSSSLLAWLTYAGASMNLSYGLAKMARDLDAVSQPKHGKGDEGRTPCLAAMCGAKGTERQCLLLTELEGMCRTLEQRNERHKAVGAKAVADGSSKGRGDGLAVGGETIECASARYNSILGPEGCRWHKGWVEFAERVLLTVGHYFEASCGCIYFLGAAGEGSFHWILVGGYGLSESDRRQYSTVAVSVRPTSATEDFWIVGSGEPLPLTVRHMEELLAQAGRVPLCYMPLKSPMGLVGFALLAGQKGARVRKAFRPRASKIEIQRLAAKTAMDHLNAVVNCMLIWSRLRETTLTKERERIWRELHDGMAQHLAFAHLRLSLLEEAIRKNDIKLARESVRGIELALTEADLDIRDAIFALRRQQSCLTEDFVAAVREYLISFEEETGIHAVFECTHDARGAFEFPGWTRLQLWRIIQEALSNVRKHSGADCVKVTLAVEAGDPVVRVEDKGRGFDVGGLRHRGGLDSMAQRAKIIGACLRVNSSPGHGTCVSVNITSRRRYFDEELFDGEPVTVANS